MTKEEMKELAADCNAKMASVPARAVGKMPDGREVLDVAGTLYTRVGKGMPMRKVSNVQRVP